MAGRFAALVRQCVTNVRPRGSASGLLAAGAEPADLSHGPCRCAAGLRSGPDAGPAAPWLTATSGTRRHASSTAARTDAEPGTRGFCPKLHKMGLLKRRGDSAGVLALFEQLRSSGEATTLHYNIAISAAAAARDTASAGAIFAELDERGEADAYSFGAYASALCRTGQLAAAVDLVDSMPAKKVAPNIVIYTTLMHGAVTAGALPLAKRLARDVEALQQRNALGSSEMLLIALLRLAAREGDAPRIARVWRKCVADIYMHGTSAGGGCSPAAIAALTVAYAQCRRPREALQALTVLQHVCAPPLTAAGAEDAAKAKGLSGTKGVVAEAEMYRAIDHARRAGLPEQASGEAGAEGLGWARGRDASGEGGEEGSGLVQTEHHLLAAFDSTLAAFSRAGDAEGTRRVVGLLREAGLKPGTSTFNALIGSQQPPRLKDEDDGRAFVDGGARAGGGGIEDGRPGHAGAVVEAEVLEAEVLGEDEIGGAGACMFVCTCMHAHASTHVDDTHADTHVRVYACAHMRIGAGEDEGGGVGANGPDQERHPGAVCGGRRRAGCGAGMAAL